MSSSIRLIIVGLFVGTIAACANERSVGGSGSENDTSFFGRIGQVFRF